MLNSISFRSLSIAIPLSFFMFSNSPLCFSRASSSSLSRSRFCLKNSLEWSSQFLTSSNSSLFSAISLALLSCLTAKSVRSYLWFSSWASASACFALMYSFAFFCYASLSAVFLVIYSVLTFILAVSFSLRTSCIYLRISNFWSSSLICHSNRLALSCIWKMEILLLTVSCLISVSSRAKLKILKKQLRIERDRQLTQIQGNLSWSYSGLIWFYKTINIIKSSVTFSLRTLLVTTSTPPLLWQLLPLRQLLHLSAPVRLLLKFLLFCCPFFFMI